MNSQQFLCTIVLVLSVVLSSGKSAEPAPEAPKPRLDDFGDPLPANALARIGTTRLRNCGRVGWLTFSPDGRQLISAGWGRVQIWDAASGKQVRSFSVGGANWLAFSPDGKSLAGGYGKDGDGVILWSMTGQQIARPVSPGPHSNGLWFDADGSHLVFCIETTMHYWDIVGARELHAFEPEGDRPFGRSCDGKRLATVGRDGGVRLWDLSTGKLLGKLPERADHAWSFDFSPDGSHAITKRHQSDELHLWELATMKLVCTLSGQGGDIAFAPDGRTLATTGHRDREVRLWDLRTGAKKRTIDLTDVDVEELAFSPDGQFLATAFANGNIRIHDIRSGQEKVPLPGRNAGEPIGFTHNGRTLDVLKDGTLRHLDVEKLNRAEAGWTMREVGSRNEGPHGLLALSGDGRLALVESDERGVAVVEAPTGKEQQQLNPYSIGGMEASAAFAPDNKTVACITNYGRTIIVWNVASGKRLWEQEQDRPATGRGAIGLAFSPDGKTLVTAGYQANRQMTFWNAATGKELRRAIRSAGEREGDCSRLAFSADGKVMGLSADGQVQLWDPAAPRQVFTLPAQGAFAFSPDGQLLAAGVWDDGDLVIKVWEVATGKSFAALRGHKGPLDRLLFSGNGRLLVSGSSDGTIVFWDVRLDRLGQVPATDSLDEKELARCWTALAGDDAVLAHCAVAQLLRHPTEAMPFLRRHLLPVNPPASERIQALIRNLDHDEFEVRDRAFEELRTIHKFAEPQLRQALRQKPTLEAKRRIEALLEELTIKELGVLPGERLRMLRTVGLLEALATQEAREHLERLAQGHVDASATQTARAALQRLARLR
jgi:WD40 repeat protein